MTHRIAALIATLALAACGGPMDDEAAFDDEAISSATYAIRNGTRDPQVIALTEGEKLAIGWMHTAGFPNEPFCTGTLVNGSVVLTAAHCLRDKAVSSINFSLGMLTPEPKATFVVAQAFAHPTLDIGVLYLTEDVRQTLPGVQPIKPNLSKLEPVAERLVKDPGEVAGYGYTWDPSLNGRFFAALAITDITDQHVVVNGQGLQGLCQGDSGAPLLVPSATGAPVLIAVEERGEESCLGQDWMTRIDIAGDWLLPALGGEKSDDSFSDPDARSVAVKQQSQAVRGCAQTPGGAPGWALALLLASAWLRRRRGERQ